MLYLHVFHPPRPLVTRAMSDNTWVLQFGFFSVAPHSIEHIYLLIPPQISLELFSVLGRNKSKIKRELI